MIPPVRLCRQRTMSATADADRLWCFAETERDRRTAAWKDAVMSSKVTDEIEMPAEPGIAKCATCCRTPETPCRARRGDDHLARRRPAARGCCPCRSPPDRSRLEL